MAIDYDAASLILYDTFARVEADLLSKSVPDVDQDTLVACETLFSSQTQAYREVLLGCIIARIQDKSINVRQPYVSQGSNAFNGRSLDERVINPFFQDQQIPSSRGPYLSVFRRSVQFDLVTREGLRDKQGYDALLSLLHFIESVPSDLKLQNMLHYVLFKFARLREEANLSVSRLHRMSLEQYELLISQLLETPSGGRFPVLLVVATFNAIKEFFGLHWSIASQGINVADTASGVAGDITITERGQILMAAEVTERPIDKSRIVTTFNTKIAPAGLDDYLFFVKFSKVAPEARQLARQYFAQGHEVNFLEIKDWILMSLATIGKNGRSVFNRVLVELLNMPDTPKTLKVRWNEIIDRIASSEISKPTP